jgi:hypothetical protein
MDGMIAARSIQLKVLLVVQRVRGRNCCERVHSEDRGPLEERIAKSESAGAKYPIEGLE